jgi:sugar O-acyltransferase (sialic acid O-acetyltransferase NeuD family)
MKDLIIYGAGGFGRETALMIEQINEDKKQWNVIGFIDDEKSKGERVDDLPVLGNSLLLSDFKNISVVIAIADPVSRANIAKRIQNQKIGFPKLIHPDANLGSKSNIILEGSIVTAGCILTTGIHIHSFVIVNLLTSIGHDVLIESNSSIMPGCSISGNVKIGERVLIGTGAKLLQNVTIGPNSTIGAGAVVTRDVKVGDVVIGVPARPKNK